MRPSVRALPPGAFLLLLSSAFVTGAPHVAAAQDAATTARRTAPDARAELYAGGELETYLRTLQDAGIAPRFPWSVRGFGPAELRALLPPDSASHPWAARYGLGADSATGPRLVPLRAGVTVRMNTEFPFGGNDGPVWAGRGITTSVMAGIAGGWGPLSFRLAPVAFRVENRDFPLMTEGLPAELPFADPLYPTFIDRPQRFGTEPYARLDPGESYVRLDALGVALGMSTSSQVWGPGERYPLLLSANAGGYPHVFLGSSRPVGIYIGQLHGRLVYGQLAQSPYSPVTTGETRRLMSGFVVSFTPRGAPGLELNASRFFHSAWPADGIGWDELTKPFEGILKKGVRPSDVANPADPLTDASNQLASLGLRWALPRAGAEVYLELAREDHSFDSRDLLMEPDHTLGRLIGLRKVWRRSDGTLLVARGESLNLQGGVIGRQRDGQGSFYLHAPILQGHTHRGQVLGADVGPGNGAGTTIGMDWYTGGGRWTVEYARVVDKDPNEYSVLGQVGTPRPEIHQTLSVTGRRFAWSFDVDWGVRYVWAMNRYLREDASNLNLVLGVQRRLW